ncbi:uncharacterized protein LOC120216166 [Hibiscus syriacus]|uniref:uncharacterized protein LOC120216166 n=1 Tax=Hibiscus syriacus TaxID=106335 RepID=UPI0019247612|nr:uncharacterized protein LOC120216166 [Hibiscus syriacus]
MVQHCLGGLSIPQHSFIAWFATLDRSLTRPRMALWGGILDLSCVLCEGIDETKDQLFAECVFSKDVWGLVMQGCHVRSCGPGWRDIVVWVQDHGKGKTLRATVLRLAWCSYLYFVWQKRNARSHGAPPWLADGIE